MTPYPAWILLWGRNMPGRAVCSRNHRSHQLDRLLRAQDLNVLGKVRHQLHSLTESETARLARVITCWKDPQAVANSCSSRVIPEDLWFGALAPALRSTEFLTSSSRRRGDAGNAQIGAGRAPTVVRRFARRIPGIKDERVRLGASVMLFGWSQEQASDDLPIRMLVMFR